MTRLVLSIKTYCKITNYTPFKYLFPRCKPIFAEDFMEIADVLMTHADKGRFATGLGTKDPRSNTMNSTAVNLVNFFCHFRDGNSAPMNENLSTINHLLVLMRRNQSTCLPRSSTATVRLSRAIIKLDLSWFLALSSSAGEMVV